MTNHADLAVELSAGIPALTVADAKFATSLLEWFKSGKTWSAKQLYWVQKLIDTSQSGKVVADAETVQSLGVMQPLYDLVYAPKHTGKLKYPKITIGVELEDASVQEVVIDIGGDMSAHPGWLRVRHAGLNLGWIAPNGNWYPFPASKKFKGQLEHTLKALGENAAGTAKSWGMLSGKCCFCNSKLTDGPSVAVGYGPVCAKQYGLPWGKGPDGGKAVEVNLAKSGLKYDPQKINPGGFGPLSANGAFAQKDPPIKLVEEVEAAVGKFDYVPLPKEPTILKVQAGPLTCDVQQPQHAFYEGQLVMQVDGLGETGTYYQILKPFTSGFVATQHVMGGYAKQISMAEAEMMAHVIDSVSDQIAVDMEQLMMEGGAANDGPDMDYFLAGDEDLDDDDIPFLNVEDDEDPHPELVDELSAEEKMAVYGDHDPSTFNGPENTAEPGSAIPSIKITVDTTKMAESLKSLGTAVDQMLKKHVVVQHKSSDGKYAYSVHLKGPDGMSTGDSLGTFYGANAQTKAEEKAKELDNLAKTSMFASLYSGGPKKFASLKDYQIVGMDFAQMEAKAIGGLKPGDLHVYAGMPGVGKTVMSAAALQQQIEGQLELINAELKPGPYKVAKMGDGKYYGVEKSTGLKQGGPFATAYEAFEAVQLQHMSKKVYKPEEHSWSMSAGQIADSLAGYKQPYGIQKIPLPGGKAVWNVYKVDPAACKMVGDVVYSVPNLASAKGWVESKPEGFLAMVLTVPTTSPWIVKQDPEYGDMWVVAIKKTGKTWTGPCINKPAAEKLKAVYEKYKITPENAGLNTTYPPELEEAMNKLTCSYSNPAFPEELPAAKYAPETPTEAPKTLGQLAQEELNAKLYADKPSRKWTPGKATQELLQMMGKA